jgi:hypothetical protein
LIKEAILQAPEFEVATLSAINHDKQNLAGQE